MSRALRSSRLRSALYAASSGRCALCGAELGRGWHADHIEPWCETRRTNVHEMQALCAPCNLKKGKGRMSKGRRHQTEMKAAAGRIIAGEWPSKKLVLDCTPGGGKTRSSIILARDLLEAGIVSCVVHVVPRSNLRRQVELDYVEHGGGFILTRSTNQAPLFVSEVLGGARVVGVVCSYAQIRANPDLYRALMRSKRTLLVCDEAGLLSDGEGAWSSIASSLHELAAFTLVMSGSFIRRIKSEKVWGVDYEPRNGKEYPKADIRYSLADAIGELAVKPMDFVRLDGAVAYQIGDDEVHAVLSDDDDNTHKLRAFLTLPTTWRPLVDMGIRHWVNWRREVYPSRMIIVASGVGHAEEIASYVRSHYGIECAQATSDLDDAHDVLSAFQGDRKQKIVGSPEVLVTVAMASIGFDVPDCTHMIYLSGYRSLPWALQAFARVTRIDPMCSLSAKLQRAFCFVPDDRPMAALIEWMRTESAHGVAKRLEEPGTRDVGEGDDAPIFIPISSAPCGVTVDGREGAFERDTSADVMRILDSVPEAAGIAPTKLAAILKFQRQQGDECVRSVAETASTPTVAPTDRKKALRAKLETTSRLLDYLTKQSMGTTNRQLRGMAQKERHELSERELLGLISWCEETIRHLPERP